MRVRKGLLFISALCLAGCIASPNSGSARARLYAWNDFNTPVYEASVSGNTAFNGWLRGNVDLSGLLLSVPDLDTRPDTPYVLEICEGTCLQVVLFPGDFDINDAGRLTGYGVVSPLSASLFGTVGVSADRVRSALDQLAGELLVAEKVEDGVIDYLDLLRIDPRRFPADTGLFRDQAILPRLDWDYANWRATAGVDPIDIMLDNAVCFSPSDSEPGFTRLPDGDGDGLCDAMELDSDGDHVPNAFDAFPNDASEFLDDDGDGIGNNADRDETIFYIVEASIAEPLEAEIQRFMADVSADTGTTPVLLPAPNTSGELRALLREGFAEQRLEGAFFIGDVPEALLRNLDFDVGLNLSDHPFRSFNCPYEQDGFNSNIWNHGSNVSLLVQCDPDIWVARLAPPADASATVATLRDYFDRNHALRDAVGNTRGFYYGAATPRERFQDLQPMMSRVFGDHSLFVSRQVTLNQSDSAEAQAEAWRVALGDNLDVVKLNVHGAAQFIQFQGLPLDEYRNVDSSEVSDYDINARVINMTSCSVGKFDERGFLGGTLLYSGSALLVEAYPVVTFVSDTAAELEFDYLYRALGMGLSYADSYRYFFSGTPPHYFGDPTIRMRPKATQGPRPRLVVNREYHDASFDVDMDFGKVIDDATMYRTVKIANTGSDALILRGSWLSLETNANDDSIPGSDGFIYQFSNLNLLNNTVQRDFSYETTVLPGQSTVLEVAFKPSANVDTSLSSGAVYAGAMEVYSNDPDAPAFRLKLTGRHIKTDAP